MKVSEEADSSADSSVPPIRGGNRAVSGNLNMKWLQFHSAMKQMSLSLDGIQAAQTIHPDSAIGLELPPLRNYPA